MFNKVSDNPLCFRLENKGARKLYISSGIHGNETSGPYTLLNLLKEPDFFNGLDVIIIPILNKYGHLHDERYNENNKDLNRDFKHQVEKETKQHVALLTYDYDLALCLHEGENANGCYIYKPNENKRLDVMQKILLAMSTEMSVDNKHKKMKSLIEPGIIGDVKYKEEHETEAVFLAKHGVDAFTIEIPHEFPIKQKEATLRAAIKQAVEILS